LNTHARRAIGFVVIATVALLGLRYASLRAADPLVRFQEMMAGANGDSRIQFITVVVEGAGATCWGPQVAPNTPGADVDDSACYLGGASETRSRHALVFFDSRGRETGRYKFPENPTRLSGAPPSFTRSRGTGSRDGTAVPRTPTAATANTILIATEAFARMPGAPPPDFVMPPLLNPISGKVCFAGNTGENSNAPSTRVCVSYGAFTGDTEGAGPPAAALSTVDTVSLRRTANGFENQNASFSRSTTPSPVNQASQSLTIPLAGRVAQGEALFRNETFGGNGRTCGECHPARDSGRLTPADVQARFKNVSATFDPLFIAETAATGFDFNLNTLTISGRPSPPGGTDFLNATGGDLRGVLTGPNGARAKVLARTSATTYLVYGGISPRLGGTITDEAGNSASVVSVTAGDLNGLEQPQRMRTSRAGAFPDGRALILENREGFGSPPVFRKSPHILNLSRTSPFGFDGRTADLQAFTIEAVQQHFPRTLARSDSGPNPDFRMPTPDELAAMEAFQLAQEFPAGSDPNKFNLDRFVTTPAQIRGRAFFFGPGKCFFCHGGPVLATMSIAILGQAVGTNGKLNTGVVLREINGLGTDGLPCEPSVGACGSRAFNVPSLFNVANNAPFFHDGSASTLIDAVSFYNSAQFNATPAAISIGGIGITDPALPDLVAFLEAISPPGPTPLSSTAVSTVTRRVSASPGILADARAAAGPSAALTAASSATGRTTDGVRLEATSIVNGLADPVDLALASDGRIFVAERSGRIRVVKDGRLLGTPVVSLPDFDGRNGTGHLSIALDPNFSRTSLLYVLYTAGTGYRLERFRVVGDRAGERAVLMDRMAPASARPAAVLRFGPDSALYAAIDDGGEPRAAANPGSFSGKVLRLNGDGTTPPDRTDGSPVYGMGLTRPAGLDWDGEGRVLVVESRGDVSTFAGDDRRALPVMPRPLVQRGEAAGLVVYRNARIPQLQNDLLIGSPDSPGLARVRGAGRGQRAGVADESLLRGLIFGAHALAAAADGTIYVATAEALIRITASP
jgi:glucose/arabinose dehydrogenase/cytochrome c peroxidase